MSSAKTIRFGQYELVERLAVGGMAELFRARVHGVHGFERTVAVKRILPHLAARASFVDMFIDEAKITAQLRHPNIVQVLDLGRVGNDLYIAMELVDGVDVLRLLQKCAKRRKRVPESLALRIAHEVLEALDHAHNAADSDGNSLGIVHRDVSPGNILVSRRGDVLLTDFGIAYAANRTHHTRVGTLKGKYSYMSPEQVSGGEVDPRSDVFGVGIVLAEMLMTRRLFAGPTELDVLLLVKEAKIDRLDQYGQHISPEVRALVERALCLDPADRYQTAAELRDAIAELLHDRSLHVRPSKLARFVSRVFGEMEEEFAHEESTITGPNTRVHRQRAEAAAAIVRERSDSLPPVRPPSDGGSAAIVAESALPEARPTELGDFTDTPAVRLLYRRAAEQGTGLLKVEISSIVKQVWLVDGIVRAVVSNLGSEQLGEFLVAQQAISPGELSMALAVETTFDSLADTFLGLGLLDADRLANYQYELARLSLIELCTWTHGVYFWYQNAEVPASAPIAVDLYPVLGAAAGEISVDHLSAWAHDHAERFPVALPNRHVTPEDFGLGTHPGDVYDLLDGRSSLAKLASWFDARSARVGLVRMIYLLVNTGLARFD